MKRLVKATGPKDLSEIEVSMHLANLEYNYGQERDIYEDRSLSHEAREGAFIKMQRIIELCANWRAVQRDFSNKTA